MVAAHTAGRLMPCRSHEDHTGPYFDIDDEDAAIYAARPFVKLVTTDAGVTVANAHDLFEFAPGDAERLCAAWNACDGLTLEQINRLAVVLHDEGVITDTLRRVLETAPPLTKAHSAGER